MSMKDTLRLAGTLCVVALLHLGHLFSFLLLNLRVFTLLTEIVQPFDEFSSLSL